MHRKLSFVLPKRHSFVLNLGVSVSLFFKGKIEFFIIGFFAQFTTLKDRRFNIKCFSNSLFQRGERCAKEHKAGTSFSGMPVNLVPTNWARLA